MKTFLINEQHKKTRMGGKGICRVFLIQDNGTNYDIVDMTQRIAELSVGMKYFDGLCLTIHYGSGTGYSRISEILKVNFGYDINIKNVSIF